MGSPATAWHRHGNTSPPSLWLDLESAGSHFYKSVGGIREALLTREDQVLIVNSTVLWVGKKTERKEGKGNTNISLFASWLEAMEQPPPTLKRCPPNYNCALQLRAFNLWAKLERCLLKVLFQLSGHCGEKANSHSHWPHGHYSHRSALQSQGKAHLLWIKPKLWNLVTRS